MKKKKIKHPKKINCMIIEKYKGNWVTREYAIRKFGFDLYYELLNKGASEYFINKQTETINLDAIKERNENYYKRKSRS